MRWNCHGITIIKDTITRAVQHCQLEIWQNLTLLGFRGNVRKWFSYNIDYKGVFCNVRMLGNKKSVYGIW